MHMFPPFGGKGKFPANAAPGAELRNRLTNLGVTKRTPSLFLRLDPVARGTFGTGWLRGSHAAAARRLCAGANRFYFSQGGALFRPKRAAQTMDEFPARFD